MRRLYIFSIFILCGFRATAAFSVVPDTISGQNHLTKQLVAEACQQLANEQKRTPFTDLNASQSQDTFERALSAAIEKSGPDIKKLAQRSKIPGAYERLRAALPTAVAFGMVRTCAPAATLYNRFVNSAVAPDGPEKAFIESWGNELCTRLATLKEQGRFQGKTSTERIELFHQEYLSSLKLRGPQIMQLYGPAGNSSQTVELLSGRMTEYMRQHCSNSLLLLGRSD